MTEPTGAPILAVEASASGCVWAIIHLAPSPSGDRILQCGGVRPRGVMTGSGRAFRELADLLTLVRRRETIHAVVRVVIPLDRARDPSAALAWGRVVGITDSVIAESGGGTDVDPARADRLRVIPAGQSDRARVLLEEDGVVGIDEAHDSVLRLLSAAHAAADTVEAVGETRRMRLPSRPRDRAPTKT